MPIIVLGYNGVKSIADLKTELRECVPGCCVFPSIGISRDGQRVSISTYRNPEDVESMVRSHGYRVIDPNPKE